jgi:hypothetical protein
VPHAASESRSQPSARRGVDFDTAWRSAISEASRDEAEVRWAREEFRAAYERRAGRFDALSRWEQEGRGRERLLA